MSDQTIYGIFTVFGFVAFIVYDLFGPLVGTAFTFFGFVGLSATIKTVQDMSENKKPLDQDEKGV